MRLPPLNSYEKLVQWDKDISYLLYRWYGAHVPTRLPLVVLEISGHGVPWLIAPILIFLFESNLDSHGASILLNFLALTLVDLAAIGVMKPLFHRKRPSYNAGIGQITLHVVDQYSFPSGHATRAGFVAAFVWNAQQYHEEGLHPIIASVPFRVFILVWALAVCVSRVALGRHHVIDVLVGAVLGASYVFMWQSVWLGPGIAQGLRDGLRSFLLGSAAVAKAANRLETNL